MEDSHSHLSKGNILNCIQTFFSTSHEKVNNNEYNENENNSNKSQINRTWVNRVVIRGAISSWGVVCKGRCLNEKINIRKQFKNFLLHVKRPLSLRIILRLAS